MSPRRPVLRGLVASLLALAATPLFGQLQLSTGSVEIETVNEARQTLAEFGGQHMESIPPRILQAAEGIAIFPGMIKGGFILGGNFGKGVLMVRRPDRKWTPPVMVSMGGGSIGFQAGVQSADIVLVFATPRSLHGILNGQKVTLGADASIALGPVGGQASAGTDGRLAAEIYSYARSRGLFLGVSLGGASLSVDNNADSMLYGRFGVTPGDVFEGRGLAYHPEVEALMQDLTARTTTQSAFAATPTTPAVQTLQPIQPQQPGGQPLVQPASTPLVRPVQPPATGAPASSGAAPPLVPITPR